MNNLIAASKRNDCLMAVFPYQNRGIWTSPFHTIDRRNFSQRYIYDDIPTIINDLGTNDFSISITYKQTGIDLANKMVLFGSEFDNGLKIRFQTNSSKLLVIYNNLFENDTYNSVEFDTLFGEENTIKIERIQNIVNIYNNDNLVKQITYQTNPIIIGNISSRCYSYFQGNIYNITINDLTIGKVVYQSPYDILYSNNYLKNILTSYGTLLWNDLDTILDSINYDWELSIKFNGSFQLNSFSNNAVFKFASMVGWVISWEYNHLLVRYINSDNGFKIELKYPEKQFQFVNCEVKFGLLNNKSYIKLYQNGILISSVEKEYSYSDFANFRNDSDVHYSKFDGTIEELTLVNTTTNSLVYSAPYSMFYGIFSPKPYPIKQNGEYSTWEEQYGLLKYSNVKVENGCFKNNEKTGYSSANIKYLQTDFIKDLKQFTIICDFDFEIVEDNSNSSYMLCTPFILNGGVTSYNTGIGIVNGNPGSIHFTCRVISNQNQINVTLGFENIYGKIKNKYGGIYVGTIDLINKKMAIFKNGIKLKEQSLSNTITGFAMLNTGESNIYWLINTNYYNFYSRGTLLFDSILSDEEIKRLSFKGEYINFNNNQKTWDDFVLKSSSINEHNFEFECIIKNTELVTDSAQIFFYHNEQGGTVNICYGENYQNIIYSYFKLKELDNNILYIGQPIVDIIQNNNIDILSKNAIHKWAFKKIGNNCQILINDIIVLNSYNDKYENALFYNDNIPITNFGNILSAKLKDLTTNTIVWQASQYDIMN